MPCTEGAVLGKPCSATFMQLVEREPRLQLTSCTRAQEEPERGGRGTTSHHLLQPAAPAQAAPAKSIGWQQTPCSHGTSFPKGPLPNCPWAAGEPPHTQHPWEGQHRLCKLRRGRWACNISSNWTWVASSAQ